MGLATFILASNIKVFIIKTTLFNAILLLAFMNVMFIRQINVTSVTRLITKFAFLWTGVFISAIMRLFLIMSNRVITLRIAIFAFTLTFMILIWTKMKLAMTSLKLTSLYWIETSLTNLITLMGNPPTVMIWLSLWIQFLKPLFIKGFLIFTISYFINYFFYLKKLLNLNLHFIFI